LNCLLDREAYDLIVGQRRFLAYKYLGLKSIKSVFSGKVNDISVKILSLTENMHRVELNHADKAEAITALYKKYKNDDRRVANELRLPLRTVRDYINIYERASKKAKRLLRDDKVTKADVKRAIEASQGDSEKADELLKQMTKLKLTKYEKSRLVELGKKHPRASALKIVAEASKPKIERVVILNLT
jgi:ParB/RepB/Spo0J family partition protein